MNTLRQLIDHHRGLADQAVTRAESYLRASLKTAEQARPGMPAVISQRMSTLATHALAEAAEHAEAYVVLRKVEKAVVHG